MAKKKSNKSLWVMLALIAVIIAVILLLFFGSLAYAVVKHLKGNDHAA